MKAKLMFESDEGKEVIVGLNALPCVGEQLVTSGRDTAEVVQIIHTPTNGTHEAIIVLRKLEASAGS